MGVARVRLQEERRSWRRDHPHGFVAKPRNKPDGSQDILMWDCVVPGKAGTCWEDGCYPLEMEFTDNYPVEPPICRFKRDRSGKPLFHPNVFTCGQICLDLLKPEKAWKPSLTIKQLLLGIQTLLNEPYNGDPAQEAAAEMMKKRPAAYEAKVRAQAKLYAPE